MKTMKNFKKVLTFVLSTVIFSSSFASIAFAATVTDLGATWRETVGSGASAVDQTVAETYNSADGTFTLNGSDAARSVVHTTTDAGSQTYVSGVALSQKVTSGILVADVEIDGTVVATNANIIRILQPSSEEDGWERNANATSGLVFQATSKLASETGSGLTYSSRWNSDIMESGVAVTPVDGVYKLKFVAEAATDESDWDIKVYFTSKHETIPAYTYTVARTDLENIKYILNTNWLGKNKSTTVTFNKFKVSLFTPEISATYVQDANDKEDRVLTFNVTDPQADLISVTNAYMVNESTGEKTCLADANVAYESGVASVTVPEDYVGIYSVDLVCKTGVVPVVLNVPLTGNPFNTAPEVTDATDGNVDYDSPLTVTFDCAIDSSTINGVLLKQGDVVIETSKALDEETKKVLTITPELPLVDGESYQVVIPTTIKNAAGVNMLEEVTLDLTAVDALYYTNIGSKYNPSAAHTISSTEGTTIFQDGKLITDTSAGKGVWYFKMDSAVESGVYYVDVKFRMEKVQSWIITSLVTGDASSANRQLFTQSASKVTALQLSTNTSKKYSLDETIGTKYTTLKPQPVLSDRGVSDYGSTDGDNNIFDLRFVVESASDTADWKVSMYDKTAPEKGAIYVGRYARDDFSSLAGISFDVSKNSQVQLYDLVIREKDDVNVAAFDFDEETKVAKVGFATVKSGKAIAAAYAEGGRLLEVISLDLTYDMTQAVPEDLTFTFTQDGIVNTKIMVWEGFANCKPVMSAYD